MSKNLHFLFITPLIVASHQVQARDRDRPRDDRVPTPFGSNFEKYISLSYVHLDVRSA